MVTTFKLNKGQKMTCIIMKLVMFYSIVLKRLFFFYTVCFVIQYVQYDTNLFFYVRTDRKITQSLRTTGCRFR